MTVVRVDFRNKRLIPPIRAVGYDPYLRMYGEALEAYAKLFAGMANACQSTADALRGTVVTKQGASDPSEGMVRLADVLDGDRPSDTEPDGAA